MKTKILLIALAFAAFARPLRAQMEFKYALDTGLHANDALHERVAFSRVLKVAGVRPLRVHFAETSLGQGSYVRLTSVLDREQQRLDAPTLALWRNVSAWFNGDAVLFELVVAPGDSNVFARVDKLVAPEPIPPKQFEPGPVIETICGDDDRVPSGDNRVGRLLGGGCTGWLVANGAALTAGHCVIGGSLPGAFEVNVPPSNANGSPNAAAMVDQFPITVYQWQNAGLGGDWCIFGLGPNNFGERAHQKFGFFRVTDLSPSTSQDVRITGFGIDTEPAGSGPGGRNSSTFTQQTAVGDVDSLNSDGDRRYYDYETDTEGASSGSPLIWEQASGWTIGVHTTGACTLVSDNYGTAFAYAPLFNAVNNWPGAGARYLDSAVFPIDPEPSGTLFRPHHTLLDAWNSAPNGATVNIVAAPYPRGAGNTGVVIGQGATKTVRFTAATGPVTIGN